MDELIKFRIKKKQKDVLKQIADKQKESLSDFTRKKLLGDMLK